MPVDLGITIDSPETRDIDDGLWIIPTETGWLLSVAISDVSAHIRKGGFVDEEAQRRVATRYFRQGNRPMLPRSLSERLLSLLPDTKRRALIARIEIDRGFNAKLLSLQVGKFHSQGRVDYPTIPSIIEAKSHPQVLSLSTVAMGLLEKRRNAGALVLYDLNDGWVTTEEGFLKKMKDTRETIGYIIVQEAMILTNSLIAEWCVKNDVPVLFRNHTSSPAAPPMAEVQGQISAALQGPWQELDAVRKRIHMLLDRANYGATLRGHVGLNLPAYLHFTSPIRRYADLVNHRQIRAKIQGKSLPYSIEDLEGIATKINAREQAERDAEKESYKAVAEDQAERALDRGKLWRMNDKEFERALKVEIRSGNDAREALQEEFHRRLAQDELPPICMTVVMFLGPEIPPDVPQPGWRTLREALVAYLIQKPELAVTIWTMASTIAEEVPVDYTEQRSGPPHAPVFQVQARNGLYFTGWVRGKTLKQAKQRAAVALLCQIHGFLPPVFQDIPDPEPVAKVIPLDLGRDPIVVLQEYAQKAQKELPSYAFRQEGPSHTPKITCTCSFESRTGVGSASNKQEAKRRAAKVLVEGLLSST